MPMVAMRIVIILPIIPYQIWVLGTLGGYNGGLKNSSNGFGPGAGKFKGGGVSGNLVGGGAGYGSVGQYHSNDTTFGITYGDSALAHLHGGSVLEPVVSRRGSRWWRDLSGSGRKWYPYHPVRSHHLRQWGRRCQYNCKWRWWRIRWVYSSCRKIDH